jgi:hypothetical protein
MRYTYIATTDAVVIMKDLDLVEQCNWEDHVTFISLEEAGLEESRVHPLHGGLRENPECAEGSIYDYVNWFYDGELDLGPR